VSNVFKEADGVYILNHPLIQHKLALLRDKNTNTKDFRELLSEVAMLMAYEVTRDLPLRPVDVEHHGYGALSDAGREKTCAYSYLACRSGYG